MQGSGLKSNNMILECNVWCSENDQAKDLGLPDGDCWLPISINVRDIMTIKLAGANDFLGEDKATIYIPGATFIVDITYKDAVKIWKEHADTI
jgi:hypothetical protein